MLATRQQAAERETRNDAMAEPTTSRQWRRQQASGRRGAATVQVRVVGQYIKDLSFENPNVRKLIGKPGEAAELCAWR